VQDEKLIYLYNFIGFF